MFATGVTIVTARDADGAAGRPHRELVQLGLARAAAGAVEPGARAPARCRRSRAARTTRSTSSPPISTLWPSASPRKALDRFAGVAFREGAGGAPVLEGAAAVFECFNRSRYEEGDHVIFVGEVERCDAGAGRHAADLPRRALLHRAAAVRGAPPPRCQRLAALRRRGAGRTPRGELDEPVDAGRVRHRVAVDHLRRRLALQQLLHRQLHLLAGQRARDRRHLEDVVRHVARRQRRSIASFMRLVSASSSTSPSRSTTKSGM